MIGLGIVITVLLIIWATFSIREDWDTGKFCSIVLGGLFVGIWFVGVVPNNGTTNYFIPIKAEVTKTEFRIIVDENGKEIQNYDSHKDYMTINDCTQFYREHFINNYGIECGGYVQYDTSYINKKLKEGYTINE